MNTINIEQVWLLVSLVMAFVYYGSMFIYINTILRLKTKITKNIIVIVVGIIGTLFTYVTLTVSSSVPSMYSLLYITLILIFKLFLQGGFWQHCFIGFQIIFHLLVMKGISVGITAFAINQNIYTVNHTPLINRMVTVIAYLFVFIFWIIFTYVFKKEDVRRLTCSRDHLSKLNGFQGILILFLLMGSDIFNIPTGVDGLMGYYVGTCVLAVITFYLILFLFIRDSLAKEYEIGYRVYEEQFAKQIESYMMQTNYIKSMRKFKHDYKKLHTTLYQLIDVGDIEKVKTFLLEMDSTMERIGGSYREFSNNVLVQAIMTRINMMCEQMGIPFTAEVLIPSYIDLTDVELCRVISNIMDNAIEASKEVEQGGFIKVKSKVHENWCTLICSNRYAGKIKMIDGELVTQKDDALAHGYGIDNIKEIVGQKKGFVNIHIDDKESVFMISIHLPLQKEVG